jgi:hypothetical protein
MSPWPDVDVAYSADSLADGWQRSFHCTTKGMAGGFEITFLYPGSPKSGPAKREFVSNGRPFRRVTVDNDLFTASETMDINIIYTELDHASDFLYPAGDTSYLVIFSTPMRWVGRMVSEWQFVQLISFEEECVYELAIRI